jgi:aminoglycoside phosphotransferase (APT) family kinase protein
MGDTLLSSDTAPVRPGEELNLTGLAAYIRERINGAPSALEVEQFPNGHSNLVYLVQTGNLNMF